MYATRTYWTPTYFGLYFGPTGVAVEPPIVIIPKEFWETTRQRLGDVDLRVLVAAIASRLPLAFVAIRMALGTYSTRERLGDVPQRSHALFLRTHEYTERQHLGELPRRASIEDQNT